MKKFSILFVGAFAILATSCNTAFFRTESPSASGAQVFQMPSQTEQVIAGIYELFVEDCSYRNRLAGPWEGLNTDIEVYRNGSSAAPTYALHSMTRSGHGDITKQGSHPWAYLTTAIERANVCIAGIEQYSDTTDKEFAYLYGEALALRAWLHYEMTKLWGDVPYGFTPMDVSNPEAIYPAKVDRNLVYDRIRKDLRTAARMMGNSGEIKWSPAANNVERMNRQFALGLLARVDLVQAGKAMRPDTWIVGGGSPCSVQFNEKDPQKRKELLEECMWACGQVMDADGGINSPKLQPKYEDVFKKICRGEISYGNTESLWELPFPNAIRGQILNRSGESVNTSAFGKILGTTGGSKSNRKMGIHPTLLFKFDPQDARKWVTINPYQWTYDNEKTKRDAYMINDKQVVVKTAEDTAAYMDNPNYYVDKNAKVWKTCFDTVAFDNVNQETSILYQTPLNISNLCLGKYRFAWLGYDMLKDDDGVNYHVMRYSDILLMFAEASIGSVSEVTPTNPTSYSGQACFDAVRTRAGLGSKLLPLNMDNIKNERAFEFCGEHIRKYDLMRWGCFGETLKAAEAELAYFYNVTGEEIDFSGTPYAGQLATKWYFKFTKDASQGKDGWVPFVISETYGLKLGENGAPADYIDSKNTGGWLRIDPYVTSKQARLSESTNSLHIFDASVKDNLDYHQYWPLFNRIIDDNHNLWNDYGY